MVMNTASNLRTHSMLAFDTLWVCDVVQESSLLCCDDKKVIVVFVVFVVLVIFVVLVLSSSLVLVVPAVSRACIIIHARWLVVFVVLVLSSSLSQWFPGCVAIHAHWCPLRGIACHRCINVIKPSSSASPSSCHLSRLVFVSSRLAVCVSYRVVLSFRLFLSRLVSPPRLCLSRLVLSCLVMSWPLSVYLSCRSILSLPRTGFRRLTWW